MRKWNWNKEKHYPTWRKFSPMTLGTANRPKGLTAKHCEKRDTDNVTQSISGNGPIAVAAGEKDMVWVVDGKTPLP